MAAIRSHQVTVICGETGSGKTTQLPQIMLAMGLAQTGMIAHTQPRRLAARAVAARIAEERGERMDGRGTVGVKVRFQDVTGRATKIKLLTDGMLLAELGSDSLLRAYSAIIIDEAHERSLNIDFLLGYLRTLLPRRPDLKVVITSATIDPKRFSEYFAAASPGLSAPPVVEVSGRGFPVEVRYRPDRRGSTDGMRPEIDLEHLADAVDELIGGRATGDVLVFLPGEREIRQAADALRRRQVGADILPLFSRLTNEEQDRIFHPTGRQRVILATNVAETSLTVPGIVYVVDAGLARISRYDPARKIQCLPIEPISRASANQRAGRCGRIAPGICIRLYPESEYAGKPAFIDPEIRRTNLASVILQMRALRLGDIEEFPFLDRPETAAIKDGYETLFELGAISQPDRQGLLTPVGERMSRIPTDPRVARMLIGAEREHAVDEIVVLGAALSIQDPRERPSARQQDADRAHAVFRDDSSDFLSILKLWDQYRHASQTMGAGEFFGWCREMFLSPTRLREWQEMATQLRSIAEELGLTERREQAGPAATPDNVHRALLTGLITNVAGREGDGSFDYRGVRGNIVQIFPGSVLFKKGPKWLMAAEVVQTTRLYARTVARVQVEWVEELAGHMFRRQYSDPHLDPETGEPSAWERVTMSGVVVVPRRRCVLTASNPAAAREIFLRDALAECKWRTDRPFMRHNRGVRGSAATLEAKLRRRDVLRPASEITGWFEHRVPEQVQDPATLDLWLSALPASAPHPLELALADVVRPDALRGMDQNAYPDLVELESEQAAAIATVEYALAPGREEDGVTLTVGLRDLPALTVDRAEWLVPGFLSDLIVAMIKTLPRAERARLERISEPGTMAASCAEAMSFANGPLGPALSGAIETLFHVSIPSGQWQMRGLPPHLQSRVRVMEDADAPGSKELAASRDIPALLKKLEPRLEQLRASQSRAAFSRTHLTGWTFGPLPESAEGAGSQPMFPMLTDDGRSVSLTLATTRREAETRTRGGIRRLFALAIADEVKYYLESHPAWETMRSQFAQLGTPEELRDQLTCVVAERTFMDGQSAVRTQDVFDERRVSQWGRLATVARETCDAVARVLDARAQIARRFSGGTPRLWAESVADIREQAAYLMPRGFLIAVRWEQLRRYPVYVEVMRERLFNLREDGSKSEAPALAAIAQHWKRFTAWVASMSKDAADDTAVRPSIAIPTPTDRSKAPLPQAKRAAPTVNLDAGEWAMRPGHLPAPMERYRWAIEEFRLAQLAPDRTAKPAANAADLDRLWRAAREDDKPA